MSAQGRYRKLYVKLWIDPDFRALTDLERNVCFYGLVGPQTNRLGFYRLSLAQMAEDLDRPSADVAIAFQHVCDTFSWQFDSRARVLWVPSWWRYNGPENANVLIGALKDLSEVPRTTLLIEFLAHVEDLEPAYRQYFQEVERSLKRLPGRSPKRSANVSPNVREPGTGTTTGTGKQYRRKKPPKVVSSPALPPGSLGEPEGDGAMGQFTRELEDFTDRVLDAEPDLDRGTLIELLQTSPGRPSGPPGRAAGHCGPRAADHRGDCGSPRRRCAPRRR